MVTFNSQMEIDCYKYSSLTAISEKKATVEWSSVLAESCVAIVVVILTNPNPNPNLNLNRTPYPSPSPRPNPSPSPSPSPNPHQARCSKSLSPAQVDIVVVGERSLLCYSESGTIRMQRRLDYTPCSCHAYPSLSKAPGAPEHHLIVGTHTGGLMIYADLELVWAARLPSPAMAVRVGT